MVRGNRGKFGIRGNVESTTYGGHWALQGSNPTLRNRSVLLFTKNNSGSGRSGGLTVGRAQNVGFWFLYAKGVPERNITFYSGAALALTPLCVSF